MFDYASDLHLEFAPAPESFFVPDPEPVLILAGDITTVRHLKQDIPFFEKAAKHWQKVFYVLGNHEFYGGEFSDRAIHDFRTALAPIENLTLLENGCEEFEGVRYIGTTLWTDYTPKDRPGNPMAQIEAIATAETRMADFRVIKGFSGMRSVAWHQRALEFLKEALDGMDTGPAVIISHHGPLYELNEAHQGSVISPAFVSDLGGLDWLWKDNLMAWVYGHLHTNICLTHRQTKIVANCRGYPGEIKRARDFIPAWL